MDWSNQSVLITGGAGSFGKKFTKILLEEKQPKKIIIFSRDELKQHEMRARSLSTRILRWFVQPRFGGQTFLRCVFWLEGVFPKFFAENGQYPMIVIHKIP